MCRRCGGTARLRIGCPCSWCSSSTPVAGASKEKIGNFYAATSRQPSCKDLREDVRGDSFFDHLVILWSNRQEHSHTICTMSWGTFNGLANAPSLWSQEGCERLVKPGFTVHASDPMLFYRRGDSSSGIICVIVVHIDDFGTAGAAFLFGSGGGPCPPRCGADAWCWMECGFKL